ncbi:MAG TPA: cytochrome c peroxidase [Kofleriaceae bacterium]|nr:cytochrome c peroxidase [Kofleriaceae bacterium]
MHRWLLLALAACTAAPPPTKAELGRVLFDDPGLSTPPGQACSDCHAESAKFRDPESDHATSMGVIGGRFGSRNAPSLMYARFVPPLHFDAERGRWIGGLFWDGRANTLEDQPAGPLLNPLEMNNPDKATVVRRVRQGPHAATLRAIYGANALDDTDRGYAAIVDALAAYERSPAMSPFHSKYDRYLAGQEPLTDQELRGLSIFEDPARGNCASCHPSRPGPDGSPPLFTDFSYANLGEPRYQNNNFYRQARQFNPAGAGYIDRGLGAIVHDPAYDGAFRVPTLRDVAKTAPYGHAGYFENLPYAVDFIASRDLGSRDSPTCSRARGVAAICAWPPPELRATADPRIGSHPLSAQEIDDVVAFLDTLTDD